MALPPLASKFWPKGMQIRITFNGDEDTAYRIGDMLESWQDSCTEDDQLTITYPDFTDPKIAEWLRECATGSDGTVVVKEKYKA